MAMFQWAVFYLFHLHQQDLLKESPPFLQSGTIFCSKTYENQDTNFPASSKEWSLLRSSTRNIWAISFPYEGIHLEIPAVAAKIGWPNCQLYPKQWTSEQFFVFWRKCYQIRNLDYFQPTLLNTNNIHWKLLKNYFSFRNGFCSGDMLFLGGYAFAS